MTRTCPFDDCGRAIPSDRFACPDHWRGMSQDLRRRVMFAWRRYTAGEINVNELRLEQELVLAEAQTGK